MTKKQAIGVVVISLIIVGAIVGFFILRDYRAATGRLVTAVRAEDTRAVERDLGRAKLDGLVPLEEPKPGEKLDANAHMVTPLMIAARNGNAGIVQLLIGSGADVTVIDSQGLTALFHACTRKKNAAVIRLLLTAGADAARPNPAGDSPLTYAIREGDSEMVREILESSPAAVESFAGETVPSGVTHPIGEAIDAGDTDMVLHLMNAGFSATARYEDSGEPLWWEMLGASIFTQDDMVTLIDRIITDGGRLTATVNEETPLVRAIRSENWPAANAIADVGVKHGVFFHADPSVAEAIEAAGGRRSAQLRQKLDRIATENGFSTDG